MDTSILAGHTTQTDGSSFYGLEYLKERDEDTLDELTEEFERSKQRVHCRMTM